MQRRNLLKSSLATCVAAVLPCSTLPASAQTAFTAPGNDRHFWLTQLTRVAHPVLDALSHRRLKAIMPVESAPGQQASRPRVTHLEALGRTLSGIAPWLEHGDTSGEEGKLLSTYRELARSAIAAAVDKTSSDYMHFGIDAQNIVDAAFLSLAILRAPTELRDKLPSATRTQLAEALRPTRTQLAGFNNWLLFAAMIEAFLFSLGEHDWDRTRVDYALREHASWYLGDGTYGDGPRFHQDYYNSFVIQPFLLTLMDTIASQEPAWQAMAEPIRTRATRYAAIQERLINTDGTYPIVGRSIAYRCGAFQLLADVSLRHALPEAVSPAQVRCALTAVIQRTLGAPGTFDSSGWLTIGLAGHQPAIGEQYISTGSLYLCTAVFLPLGLAPTDPFWSAPPAPWTSQRLWRGDNLPNDHAINS
jgi:hypothetical protein